MRSPGQANTGRWNMELNACGIRVSSYVPTYRKLQANTGRWNTEFNTCGIHAYSNVPTYINMQNPIQIDAYIYTLF